MELKTDDPLKYSTERREIYARWMELGARSGLLMLGATFLVYVFDALESHVPIETLPSMWTLPASEFTAKIGFSGGWSWLKLAHRSDFLNYIGLCFLASVTLICYVRLLPILIKEKDIPLSSICALEILVFILAASGILGVGH